MKAFSRAMRVFTALTIALCVILGCSCGDNAGSGDYRVLTDCEIGEQDGYGYELWKDNGTTSMTLKEDGRFSCEWSDINNALFRRGMKFDCTKTWQEVGNITLSYDVDYNPDGNSYLALYGWTREPLVEYYIVESWGNWRPPGGNPTATIKLDGADYDIYETTRYNQPSIDGNTTFQQYWCVRQEKRSKGEINVGQVFASWEALGMKMGKLYEASLTVEGYQSRGNADILKNELSIGGDIPAPAEGAGPQEPDENGYYYNCSFDSGTEGWEQRGSSNVSASDRADGLGKCLKVTGRQDAWNGAGRSLRANTFIPGNIYSFGVSAMQDSAETVEFKLTLQYNINGQTDYAEVAAVEAAKGEWVTLANPEFTIPEGATAMLLYVETASGKDSFYIDDAYGAIVK